MTKEINGVMFQVINSKYYKNAYEFDCENRKLSSVYAKCSKAKESVWDWWYLWHLHTNVNPDYGMITKFGVYNGNSWNFTIRGIYINMDGTEYGIMITSSNNKLYKL